MDSFPARSALLRISVLLMCLATLARGLEEVLYTTIGQSSLDWTTYHFTPGSEWYIQGVTGELQYAICRVTEGGDQHNWLRTNYIETGDANRVNVSIQFTVRECDDIPQAVTCKETFDLHYYESNSDDATDTFPNWSVPPYTTVDKIAADGRLPDVNHEHRQFPATKNGFYLALEDEGSCLGIKSVSVYYYVCPEVTDSFARFARTPAGQEDNSLVTVNSYCVENSESVNGQTASYVCQSNGEWHKPAGQDYCYCKPGYQPSLDETKCEACVAGTYKTTLGNGKCAACPSNSYSTSAASSSCDCVYGYYRATKDPISAPCSKPPSAPTDIQAAVSESSVVMLSWKRPDDDGGRSDLEYRVECQQCLELEGAACTQCPPETHYTPGQRGPMLSVNISYLQSYTLYTFSVYAENGVSDLSSSQHSYATITAATTSSVSSSPTDINIIRVNDSCVDLQWKAPAFPNGVITEYEIRYRPSSMAVDYSKFVSQAPTSTSTQSVLISHLETNTEYIFEIRAWTENGAGLFSNGLTYSTSGDISSLSLELVAGLCVAIVVIVLIVLLILGIFFWRKRKGDPITASNDRDNSTVFSNGEGTPQPQVVLPVNKVKNYIDPHTYEDLNQAVRDFAKEIDTGCIKIEEVIGGGEFGDVCRGILKLPSKDYKTVAIKTLKAGASLKDRNDFLAEASIMGQFDDPNIIKLEGVVTKSTPYLIITEFMDNGSLDRFLKAHDGKFTVIQLVGMMRGIASGMKYLAEMNYVHRDLAARNTLVNERLVCKVCDFGLSRVKEEGIYETKGGKIPIRWTAPEAIQYKKFTSASDVWSYGIVAWEIMSYGERPYWNWSNQDVIKSVEKGYRLPPPMDCPQALHQLMLDCWQKDRNHRPTFGDIVLTLDRLIRNPATLRNTIKSRFINPMDPNMPDLTNFKSVAEWLDSIKMGRYIASFNEAGYMTVDSVIRLTVKDLEHLGVTLVGHQKKIMNSIQTMRAQLGRDGVISLPVSI